MKLLDDITRCDGLHFDLMLECHNCARRIAPRTEYVWMMDAPNFVNGRCPMRIENED